VRSENPWKKANKNFMEQKIKHRSTSTERPAINRSILWRVPSSRRRRPAISLFFVINHQFSNYLNIIIYYIGNISSATVVARAA